MKIIIFITILAAIIGFSSAQSNDCVGQAENSVHPSYVSCAHYFQCIGGVAILDVCQENLLFNPATNMCDHRENVECEEVTFPPPIEIECYPDGIEKHPHPYSCNKFIMCFDGWQIEQECAPQLHWSVLDGFCTTQDLAECSIESSLCPEVDDPDQLVFIPSSRDCNRYYICHNHQTIGLNCAPGKHFDPINNWCDLPENANCEVAVGPEPETPPPIDTIQCPDDGFYYRPHPTTCEYYFLCANGESTMMQCAPGLKFDTKTDRCTLADDATCIIASPL